MPFEEDCTLGILEEDCIRMPVTLCFEKIIGPEKNWHEVVCSDEFSFGGTASIDLLLGGSVDWHAFTKRHAPTRVTMHVRMRGVRPVNPPFGNRDGVCT